MSDVKVALKKLQGSVRSEPATVRAVRTASIPQELASDAYNIMGVGAAVMRHLKPAVEALQEDIQFEHLEDKADDAVWEFACRCRLQMTGSHVDGFIREYAKEPVTREVWFAVDHLVAEEAFHIGDVEFAPLPPQDTKTGEFLRHDAACGAVAKVQVRGTSLARMLERGREQAEHGLRLLRLGLKTRQVFHRSQLRFRLGESYVLGDSEHGWKRSADSALPLELPKPPSDYWPDLAFLDVPCAGLSEVQTQAALALKWLDEAHMAVDAIHQTLFLFCALEAILGDKGDGLKSEALVFYRTHLGQVVSGHFPSPSRLYYFYDKVRSYAVHGQEPLDFPAGDVGLVERSIQESLYEFVAFYEQHQLTTREKVRKALLMQDDAQRTLDWLRANDHWGKWTVWSPWEKPSKKQKEEDLAAEVQSLKDERDSFRRSVASELGVDVASTDEQIIERIRSFRSGDQAKH